MRNDLIESFWIGGAIGVAVLLMHLFTTGAAPQVQLIALLAAALMIAAAQLLLSSWRQRQGTTLRSQSGDHAPNIAQLRRRRNPFFRELARDWTGLDEYS